MCDLKPSMVSPYAPCPSTHCYSPADIPQNFAWHPPSFHPSTCSQNTTSAHQSPALYCPFLSLWLAAMAAAHKPAPQSYPFCLHFLRLPHRTSSRTDACSTLDLSAPRRQKRLLRAERHISTLAAPPKSTIISFANHMVTPSLSRETGISSHAGIHGCATPYKAATAIVHSQTTFPHQIKGQHCQFLFISMHEYAGPDPLCILVTPLTSRLTSAFSLRTTANAFRYMQASCTNKQAKNNEHVRQTCRTKTQPSRSLMVIKRAIVWSAKGKKQCAIEAAYVLAWQGWLMIRGTLQYPLLSL